MGGPLRREVRAYATGAYRLNTGDPVDYIVPEVQGYVSEGVTAVKLKIGFGIDEDEQLIRAVRKAIGPATGLMLDANHGFYAIEAIELDRRVASLIIGWFEERVVANDPNAYVEVRRGQPIPIAGGECAFTRWGFCEVLARRRQDLGSSGYPRRRLCARSSMSTA